MALFILRLRSPASTSPIRLLLHAFAAWVAIAVSVDLHAQGFAAPADDVAVSTDRPWQVRSYAQVSGLAQQRIFDITFTPDGTAWLACTNGLWSYDGYHWTGYGPSDGLPSRFVRAVLFSKKGELWVGTDKGAGVFDPVAKRWEARGSDAALPNQNVRSIAEYGDGSLWFCCDQWPDSKINEGGIARLADGNWTSATKADGLPLGYVIGSFRAKRGDMYAFTPRGTVRLLGNRWAPIALSGDDLDAAVVQMVEGADGRIFAQGENHLFMIDGQSASLISEDNVLVTRCADGRILGLRREPLRNSITFDQWDGGEFRMVSASIPVSPQSRFYRLAEAPDGSIWCVGQGILLRWSRQGAWNHYPKLPQLTTVDHKGNPWFNGSGRVLWHDASGFHSVPSLNNLIGIDRDDTLVGRDNRGRLITASPATGAHPVALETALVSVTHTQVDREGALWLAGKDGSGRTTFSVRDGLKTYSITNPKFGGRRVYSLQTPESGEGILGVLFAPQSAGYDYVRITKDGIEELDLGNDPPAIPYPAILPLKDSYIVSGYSAVSERKTGGSAWLPVPELSGNTYIGTLAGPSRDVVFTFQNDRAGRSGIALRHDGKWLFRYGEFEAPSLDLFNRRLYVISRSKLYRQNTAGTLDFDVLNLPEDAFITRATVDAEGITWLNTTSGVFSHAPETSPPLPQVSAPSTEIASRSPFRIHVEARSRYDAATVAAAFQFSYRVDSDAWSPFNQQSDVDIATEALSPGPHRLEVIARSADGVFSITPATLNFNLQPVPLQYRRWFPLLIAGTLGIIAFLAWLGISRARALMRSHRALNREYSIRVEAEQALARALNDLKAAHGELEIRVVERTAELSEANTALRKALVEREESERSRTALEHQLREAQKMEAIGTLAGGIAHDFNNILTVIIPCTGIALDDTKHLPAVRDNLRQVLQAAERAKKLVQQILAFSRRQKPEQRPLDLKVLVRETHQLLRSAIPSTIAVNLRMNQDIPLVMADGTQLHQVLMNLCTNARHAVPVHGGIITITVDTLYLSDQEVRLTSELAAGQYVRLSIEDNGRGIPSDILPRIFEPFFTTKSPGEGTGLGLSVAHGIVKDHHGTIRVFSREAIGTRFDVLLPPASASEVAIASQVVAPSTGRGENILIVDDEFMVSRIMSQVLSRTGYRPSVHTRPEVALNEFLKHPSKFQLLLTDLTMPGMNGLELARSLRAQRPDLPIILMTGYGGDVPAGVESKEVDLVIFKPFDANALVVEIEKLLNRTAARKAPPPEPREKNVTIV